MRTFIVDKSLICDDCFSLFNPVFSDFKIDKSIKCLSIYKYDDLIKEKLFLLKGCYDIEIAPVFITAFSHYLNAKYCGYIMVPVPSYMKHDEARGFNHVLEIFKPLKLELKSLLVKVSPIKQSDQPLHKRHLISDSIIIEDGAYIKNRKVLIIDDVYTTGMTIKTCINLIKKFNPKAIQVLVLSKVEHKEDTSL